MTEKELHKLKREDLLRLLLAQSREAVRQKAELEALRKELAASDEGRERLKDILNKRDAQLTKLRKLLEEKEDALQTAQKQKPFYMPVPQADPENERRLRRMLGERDEEVHRLRTMLARAETQQQQLSAQLLQLQGEHRQNSADDFPALDYVLEEFQASSRELREKLDAKERQVERLTRQLEQKDGTLRELSTEMQSLRNSQKQMLTELRGSNEEMKKALDRREAEIRELRLQIERADVETQDLWTMLMGFVTPAVNQDGGSDQG